MRLVAATITVAILGACSAGASNPTASTRAKMVVLDARLSTTGALVRSASYTSTTGPNGARSCAVAASRGNSSRREFVIAAPGSREAPVYFGFRTVTYRGPGTYRQSAVRLDSIATVIDRATVDFRRARGSVVSMTVSGDGSGTASFTSFVSDDGRTLDGRVHWTCRTQEVRA
jgi:hypothetical protein